MILRHFCSHAVICFVFFLSAPVFLLADSTLPLVPENLLLTTTTPEKLNPNFWISRIPGANDPIMTPDQLKAFNQHTEKLIPQLKDVYELARTRAGKEIRTDLEHVYLALKSRKLYDAASKDLPKSFFEDDVRPVMVWESVPNRIKVRWGAAARSTSVRALPSDKKILEKPHDIEFDQLQYTLIKAWTPVAVLHESSDSRWFYVQAPYTRGWVHSKDICLFPSREDLKATAQARQFLVVTGDRVPIYAEKGKSKILFHASMGTIFPFVSKDSNYFDVRIPKRGSREKKIVRGYVSRTSDVSIGYKPFTQANVIRQAFKLLGSRYGWGGMYQGRDCSGFTHDVFLSLGVNMPRNSQEQAFIGTKLGFFTAFDDRELKTEILRQARPGITLMAMSKHLMLYLGEVDGQFYTIHSTWAERISMNSDAKNRINQIVVTDLTLNGRSYLGSLFDRIISINEVA